MVKAEQPGSIWKTLTTWLSFTLVLAAPGAARASGLFAPVLRYSTQKATDDTGVIGNSDTNSLVLDARLGYVFDEYRIVAGAIYRMEGEANIAGSTKGYAFGPSLGWVNSGLSVFLTYFIRGERTYTVVGAPKKLLDGRGWQIDVAWAPKLSENFGLGPALTWQRIRFAGSQIGTSDATGDGYEEIRTTPGLIFWWAF